MKQHFDQMETRRFSSSIIHTLSKSAGTKYSLMAYGDEDELERTAFNDEGKTEMDLVAVVLKPNRRHTSSEIVIKRSDIQALYQSFHDGSIPSGNDVVKRRQSCNDYIPTSDMAPIMLSSLNELNHDEHNCSFDKSLNEANLQDRVSTVEVTPSPVEDTASNNCRDDDDFYRKSDTTEKQLVIKRSSSPKIVQGCCSSFKSIIGIYADQSGSCLNLTKGLTIMALMGSLFGFLMPKNSDLSGPYKTISSMIGYTYFIASTVCFYPQIVTNYQLKSIDGLSTDSIICGILKNLFYTIYTAGFFFNTAIQNEYRERNGPDADITVMSNDVAYGIHALLLTMILLGQILYYTGFAMSNFCKFFVSGMTLSALIYAQCILLKVDGVSWIDLLYLLATFNLLLTMMQYLPQIWLNYMRKSTQG